MRTYTEAEIRGSFVNASRGVAQRAEMPDVAGVPWADLDYLGWHDPKRPLLSYVAAELDGDLVTVLLRRVEQPSNRRTLCNWCQDVHKADRAVFYSAARAGEAGRRGNTIATLICPDFQCSANVRRPPSSNEMSSSDPLELQYWMDVRINELRERSSRFIREVLRG